MGAGGDGADDIDVDFDVDVAVSWASFFLLMISESLKFGLALVM